MPDLKNLAVEWVSLVDRAAVRDPEDTAEPMRFLVWKRDATTTTKGGGHMTLTPEEQRAALEKAEAERDELKGKLDKSEADQAEQKAALDKAQADLEELKKAAAKNDPEAEPAVKKEDLPEPVRKALEKAEADAAALAERLEKSEQAAEAADKLAKAERETRLTKEYIAKADAYKALPVKGEDFGPVLKAAAEKLTADEYEALSKALDSADAGLAASDLFKEQGRARGQSDDSALSEATQKAAEIKKADPKLSDSEALDKAFAADRGLQERYLAEVR